MAQAWGLLSVYKTWVFYTLTYAQTVAASLPDEALPGTAKTKTPRPAEEATREKLKARHSTNTKGEDNSSPASINRQGEDPASSMPASLCQPSSAPPRRTGVR